LGVTNQINVPGWTGQRKLFLLVSASPARSPFPLAADKRLEKLDYSSEKVDARRR